MVYKAEARSLLLRPMEELRTVHVYGHMYDLHKRKDGSILPTW